MYTLTQRKVLIGAGAALVIVLLAFWIGTSVGNRAERAVRPLRAELATIKADLAAALDKVEATRAGSETLGKRIEEHGATAAAAADQASSLSARVETLSGSSDALAGKVGGLGDRVGTLEDATAGLRAGADNLEKAIQDRLDETTRVVDAMKQRVSALEEKLAAVASDAPSGDAKSRAGGGNADAAAPSAVGATQDDVIDEGERVSLAIGSSLWLPERAGTVVVSSVTDSGARLVVNRETVELAPGESTRFRLGDRACRLTLEGVDGRKAVLAYGCS